jgi:hypothetical protein
MPRSWMIGTARPPHFIDALLAPLRHLQLDPIVRGVDQILFRPEVPLGRLHRRMAEEQLDLFKLPTSSPAQFRACTACHDPRSRRKVY